jgi:Pyruvate/2-oxoacid:ferredoxin oxidoreductase gamma subunit
VSEREVLLTGIGGQGVQLAARVLAQAALRDGKEVQLFASYGGMMRGGNTDATVVIGDEPIHAPPVVGRAWGVVGLHHEHLAGPIDRVRPDGLVLVNDTVVEPRHVAGVEATVLTIACTDLAAEVGNPMAGGLVAVGALAAATGLVAVDSLVAAIEEALPSYRRQHVDSSVAALRAGVATALVGPPAWEPART